ncbi:asparagine synthase (glutamine-hydrolyzing) [Alkaliphilus peptidifermentans]|uniref:asparagine synthase (glutamine-hydrolyzing) n=1 Tax=Alkaliphilus peptidifermentans DSM 18978 TaxID=1120976 RepID=A0A1G5J2K9_9FIRM|nr:asparagine synthase (glutamine-hydrolyzing) [Alkaliphilus peptidifermentans]SCY82211.1 asparagine synthase (glutamine-hydrolysing) [Alkaliphilus peptidifermentans DSM 18978]
MCGIAGWINLKEDLTDKVKVIETMTNTLSKRGPDAFNIYKSKNCLLGHRRLIVVDPEGGGQPMIRKVEDRSYSIVYNGELYNTEVIRRELLDKGYHFKSYSDTEVLLMSYIEWGFDCVKKLNGIFAFGIWNEYKKELFMARDRLGVKPLFYSQINNNLFLASEIKAILANPVVEPIITKDSIMELFGLGPARALGSGVFKDIFEVPPAYFLIYNDDGIKLKQYWQLGSKPHTDDFDTSVNRVKELLVDAVERQLISDVPVCTFLSGGLDSSCISAIAAKSFEGKGRGKLNTYSVDYLDNDHYFKPSIFQPDSDISYIKQMSQFIDSNHHSITIDTPQLADGLYEAVKATDLPGMADVDSSLYLFCKEVKKSSTVALSGECADEIFGGYPWFTREEFINANTFPWSQAIKERKGILSKEYVNLPIEDYVHHQYQKTLRDVPKLEGETLEEERIREIFYLNLKWFMVTLLNRKDRMSMANGLEVRVPFADHWLVEYVWNIPWNMKYHNNREKGILREALQDILPPEIINRKKSPYPKTHNPSYLKVVQSRLSKIIKDTNSPLLQLIDGNKVKEIIESDGKAFGRPWFGQLMTAPQLMAYLIQVDIWMREYNVKIQ